MHFAHVWMYNKDEGKTTPNQRGEKMARYRARKWQGMNWIRQEKRLAIYLRDGLSCCYCGSSIEDHIMLTLDHLAPYSKHGTNNDPCNLVTCCEKCNKSRGNRSLKKWLSDVSSYINHGITPKKLFANIHRLTNSELPMKQAKALIAKRGSCFKALKHL